MSKPPRVKLTYSLEAASSENGLANAVSSIHFSGAAREKETGDRLVRMAIWSLQEYAKDRWASWEEAPPAAE